LSYLNNLMMAGSES